MKQFKNYHPVTLLIYYLSVMILVLFTYDPLIMIISFFSSYLYFLITMIKKQRLKQAFKMSLFYLLMFLLMSLITPLTNHQGETVLFYLYQNKITLEALYYGIVIAMMFLTMIVLASNINLDITPDKSLYLFGKTLPNISTLLFIAFRFVPLFYTRTKEIIEVQKTLFPEKQAIITKINSSLHAFMSALRWALESSIETADALLSKGYGIKKRTNYNIEVFEKKDLITIILIICCDIIFFTFFGLGYYDVTFYPTIIYFRKWYYYLPLLIMFIPLIIEGKEALKWQFLKSKI